MTETLMSLGTGDQNEQITMTRRDARRLLAAAWSEGRMTGREELADSTPSAFVPKGWPVKNGFWIARNPYREIEEDA